MGLSYVFKESLTFWQNQFYSLSLPLQWALQANQDTLLQIPGSRQSPLHLYLVSKYNNMEYINELLMLFKV